jgi:hypothetical protein
MVQDVGGREGTYVGGRVRERVWVQGQGMVDKGAGLALRLHIDLHFPGICCTRSASSIVNTIHFKALHLQQVGASSKTHVHCRHSTVSRHPQRCQKRRKQQMQGLTTYEDPLKRCRPPPGTFPESWLLDTLLQKGKDFFQLMGNMFSSLL